MQDVPGSRPPRRALIEDWASSNGARLEYRRTDNGWEAVLTLAGDPETWVVESGAMGTLEGACAVLVERLGATGLPAVPRS